MFVESDFERSACICHPRCAAPWNSVQLVAGLHTMGPKTFISCILKDSDTTTETYLLNYVTMMGGTTHLHTDYLAASRPKRGGTTGGVRTMRSLQTQIGTHMRVVSLQGFIIPTCFNV